MDSVRPDLTIITDPVMRGRYLIKEPIKRLARHFRNKIKPPAAYMESKYRGHFAVTRSMVEGLQKIGVRSNYNPSSLADVAETVVVPGGFDALRQAIAWKRSGRVRRLLAGTNLVDFPSERRELICAPEIDLNLVPCGWFRDNFIADCPELQGRVETWAAGVDTAHWSPDPDGRRPMRILFYHKQIREPLPTDVFEYLRFVEELGFKTAHLEYGKYMPRDYLTILRSCSLMIGFSPDESQGIAWAEAWSVNVPTLMWKQDCVTYKGRTYAVSTAPYLTPATGLFFSDMAEFERAFQYWQKHPEEFYPRRWVIENMSDEMCARHLCELARIPLETRTDLPVG